MRRVLMLIALTGISARLHAQTPRTLSVTRDLRLDAAANDFSMINPIEVGADGSIAAVQRKDNKISFFDAKGTPLGSVGRTGEGPGEFRYLGDVGWYRDTLWVTESRRLTLFSPQRKFIRTDRIPTAVKTSSTDSTPVPIFNPTLRGIRGDGGLVSTYVLRQTGPRPSWAAADEARTPVVLSTANGVFQKLLGWLPSLQRQCDVAVKPPFEAHLQIPYCAVAMSGWGTDGSRFALVTQNNPAGVTGNYQVTVISTSGDTVFARSYGYTTNAIPGKDIDSVRTRLLDPKNRYPSPDIYDAYRTMNFPATYPPVSRTVVGRDGTIWLQVHAAGAGHTWRVLSTKGDVVGQLTLPANVELKAASRSAIWAVEKDADDLPSVVRYKVGQ